MSMQYLVGKMAVGGLNRLTLARYQGIRLIISIPRDPYAS